VPQEQRRPRVIHVYKDVYPPVEGGVEGHIDGLRRSMPGVESGVVVCSRSPHTIRTRNSAGWEVRVAEYGPRWWSVPFAPALPAWLARLPSDLLHVHMPNPLGELAALIAARDRPLVLSYHADIVRQARVAPAYRRLVERCIERCAALIVGTRGLLETSPLLDRARREREKVHVIPYGVDVDRFRPGAIGDEEVGVLRKRYGSPIVLCVGRLVHYKGVEQLIAAAGRLDAAIVIVGTGPLEAGVRELAAQARNVHIAGRVSERVLLAHLAAADCFVLPSVNRAESFGVATLEAQAFGLPAVVTDVGSGTLEAIEPGRTAVVVPPADPEALREAIAGLLGDAGRRAAMGAAARKRVVERHALTRQAARVEALYRDVLANGSSRGASS
jgi:glycosyltransferase involved in cell wall biosynthesis